MEILKTHVQNQESNYLETSPIDHDQLEKFKVENVQYKVKAQ
jgi:hypothetical protein